MFPCISAGLVVCAVTPGSGSFALSLHMAQWHRKTLETLEIQGSHSAIHCYVAGTMLLAELTPREAEIKTSVYSKQAT